MWTLIIRALRPPVFPQDEEKTRSARNTNAILLLMLAFLIAFEFLYIRDARRNGWGLDHTVFSVVLVVTFALWAVLKSGRIILASNILVGLLWVSCNSLAAFKYGIRDSTYIVNIPICLLASFLVGWRAGAILSALSILSGFGLVYLETIGRLAPFTNYPTLSFAIDMAGILAVSGALTYLLISNLRESLERARANTLSLEQANSKLGDIQGVLQNRTEQLAAVNEVSSVASAILDPTDLIDRVVGLITQHFNYYYVAFFTIDETGKWAVLRSASGEAGRVLKESRHRLEIGGRSMVGAAIARREPRVALDVGAESVRFDNPLLPYTRSEVALPLIAGNNVLGALDVQSTKQGAFGQQEIETLQGMAKQLAVALENAHLYQLTNQRLEELQTAQRQYLKESWSLVSPDQPLEYNLGEEAGSNPADEINVPLTLRNEIIGQITLEVDSSWSPEERAWIDSIATQTAIALENARLLETSKKFATSEKVIAEITSKIWASNTIDGILQTAVRELGKTFNAAEVTITLDQPETSE